MSARGVVRWAVALLCAGAPVTAAEADRQVLRLCLEHRPAYAHDSCVGLASAPCLDTDLGHTTHGSIACINAETALWDEMLNAEYARIRAAQGGTALATTRQEALRDMQRAWIAYRDALCMYEYHEFGGGQISQQIASDCEMQETARQALRLKHHEVME